MEPEKVDRVDLAAARFQIAVWEEVLARRPDDTEALRSLAHAYTLVGRLAEGLRADRRLAELMPSDPRVRYNLACSLALTGEYAAAIAELARACELGFDDLNLLRRDQDFESLRDHPGFRAVCEELERGRER